MQHRWLHLQHTGVASPTKKKQKAYSADKSTTGSTFTAVFFTYVRAKFRNSAMTPASPLIKKSTTLRSSLWCSRCSVAKRQQFSSCPLGTPTLSSKLKNVVPVVWFVFSRTAAECFFLLLLHRWAVVTSTRTYEYFIKSWKTSAVSTTDWMVETLLCAAWYIRHVRWTCLFYIWFIICFLWTKPTMRLFILSFIKKKSRTM